MLDAVRKGKRIGVRIAIAAAMVLAEACATSSPTGNPYVKIPTTGAGSYYTGTGSLSGNSPSVTPTVDETGSVNLAPGYKSDESKSQALTDYLKQRRLPLVGAQVLNWPDGKRAVVLYGYVGSGFGKNDAVTKARTYLGNSSIVVDNRIKVEPELLTQGSKGAGPIADPSAANANSYANSGPGGYGSGSGDNDSGAGSYPDANSYIQQQQTAQQLAQQQGGAVSIGGMAPLLMLGALGLSVLSHGSFTMGGGSFGTPGMSPFGGGMIPFGSSPSSNPYPGYPSLFPPTSPYNSVPPPGGPYGP